MHPLQFQMFYSVLIGLLRTTLFLRVVGDFLLETTIFFYETEQLDLQTCWRWLCVVLRTKFRTYKNCTPHAPPLTIIFLAI